MTCADLCSSDLRSEWILINARLDKKGGEARIGSSTLFINIWLGLLHDYTFHSFRIMGCGKRKGITSASTCSSAAGGIHLFGPADKLISGAVADVLRRLQSLNDGTGNLVPHTGRAGLEVMPVLSPLTGSTAIHMHSRGLFTECK